MLTLPRALALASLLLSLGGCATVSLPDGSPVPDHPLLKYHRVYRPGKPWRLTLEGVEVRGRGIPRTEGKPLSADAIWRDYNLEINRWSAHYKVPAELIIAVIAIEGKRKGTTWSRDPESLREEAGYVSDDVTPQYVAVGLMQVTLATARAVAEVEGIDPASVDRRWLMVPDNAIRLGTAYLARQARGQLSNAATLLDPPVAIAAYNAGGIRRMGGHANPWKLKQYPSRSGEHVTKGVSFFNDAVAVLKGHSIPTAYGYHRYLSDLDLWMP